MSAAEPEPTDTPWPALLAELRAVEDFALVPALAQRARRVLEEHGAPPGHARARVALLGGDDTSALDASLLVAFLAAGVAPELSHAPHGAWVQELVDPESVTARARPELACVLLSWRELSRWPAPGASASEVAQLARELAHELCAPAASFHAASGATVVLTSFPPPSARPYGHAGARRHDDPLRFVRRVLLELGDALPPGVELCDLATLAERRGLEHWSDARLWHAARQAVAPACALELARALAGVCAAQLGRARKLVVCDLDDTLWGGALGELGLEGIELGPDSPRGEQFAAFQDYLCALKRRGVLLAACTRNEIERAREPFERHPSCALGLEDFVAFEADWGSKVPRLLAIAEELDLPLDALVFLDDDPAQRAEVRRELPEVAVPELVGEPAEWPALLERQAWLEAGASSEADGERTASYRGRSAARRAQLAAANVDDFMASLAMRARVAPFGADELPRLAQLFQRTNQYNLRTRRRGAEELAQLGARDDVLTLGARLSDRYCDHGLVAALVARARGDSVHVEDWLMSCRVLRRGLSARLLNALADWARARGARELVGEFEASGRNELVREHYARLGFERVAETSEGTTHRLALDDWQARPHHIEDER